MRFTCIYYNEKERKNLAPFISCLQQYFPDIECRIIADTIDDAVIHISGGSSQQVSSIPLSPLPPTESPIPVRRSQTANFNSTSVDKHHSDGYGDNLTGQDDAEFDITNSSNSSDYDDSYYSNGRLGIRLSAPHNSNIEDDDDNSYITNAENRLVMKLLVPHNSNVEDDDDDSYIVDNRVYTKLSAADNSSTGASITDENSDCISNNDTTTLAVKLPTVHISSTGNDSHYVSSSSSIRVKKKKLLVHFNLDFNSSYVTANDDNYHETAGHKGHKSYSSRTLSNGHSSDSTDDDSYYNTDSNHATNSITKLLTTYRSSITPECHVDNKDKFSNLFTVTTTTTKDKTLLANTISDDNNAVVLADDSGISKDDIVIVCSFRGKKKLLNKHNVYYLDHGTSWLKDFISRYLYIKEANFFFCNPVLHRLAETIIGNKMDSNFISGYINTDINMVVSQQQKLDFCQQYGLDYNRPLIFYAPTYIADNNVNSGDYEHIKQQLMLLDNVYTIQHVQGVKDDQFCNTIPNKGDNCNIGLAIADIVISDTSSMLFEAVSLGKQVVQILLKYYSGNKLSGDYKLPLIPVINQPFIAGVTTLPWHLAKTVIDMLKDNSMFRCGFAGSNIADCSATAVYDSSSSTNQALLDTNQLSIPDKIGQVSYASRREDGKDVHRHVVEQILAFEQYKAEHELDYDFKNKQVHKGEKAPAITVAEYQSWFNYPPIIRAKLATDRFIAVFGTFDAFHVGHLRILQRARQLGTHLIVGVSSDALNIKKKARAPIINERDRAAIVAGLKCVDHVFIEHSLELKRHYLHMYQIDCLCMGDDWYQRLDHYSDICQVHYLPRTENVSTTELIAKIQTMKR